MRIGGTGLELTYCTNIHPASGWPQVFDNLRSYAPALKSRLSPGAPFGLGLRLSASEAEELLGGGELEEFRQFLEDHGLYVALLNGFPFGSFYQRPVKSDVFAPDWRDERRVVYTLRLLEILSALLPRGAEGGISTVPLSYKRWIGPADAESRRTIAANLRRVAEAMARLKSDRGIVVHLDIEPEPDGLVENTAELAAFFREWLLPGSGTAERSVLAHAHVCLDTCHFAVEYEEAQESLRMLAAEGIRIGRVQVSAALQLRLPGTRAELAERLSQFSDPIYLHQVIERDEQGSLQRYPDLPAALGAVRDTRGREWRIHFHVPLFCPEHDSVGTTAGQTRDILRLVRERELTRHLEIETYTWSVLPDALKLDLLDSIEREYRWTLQQLCAKPQSSTLSA